MKTLCSVFIILAIAVSILFISCGKKEEKDEMTVEDAEKILEAKKALDEMSDMIIPEIEAHHNSAVSTLRISIQGMMKTMAKKDYDQNGKKDYPASICLMHYGVNSAGECCQLIGKYLAHADFLSDGTFSITYKDAWDEGKEKTKNFKWEKEPKQNYWYAMIPKMADGTPYKDKYESHYAICAFPAKYGEKGKLTFIMNEKGVIYQKDLGEGKLIDQWPADDPATKGWEKVEKDQED